MEEAIRKRVARCRNYPFHCRALRDWSAIADARRARARPLSAFRSGNEGGADGKALTAARLKDSRDMSASGMALIVPRYACHRYLTPEDRIYSYAETTASLS